MPTGYSFNLDGTAIYLTMASLFIAEALGDPLSHRRADLPAAVHDHRLEGRRRRHRRRPGHPGRRPASHRPELVDGVGLIVGIDRFMSEARALTNFAGNAVATVLIGHWTGGLDRDQLDAVLAGDDPFDETTMLDEAPPERGACALARRLGRPGADATRAFGSRRLRRVLRTQPGLRLLGPSDLSAMLELTASDPVVNVFADYRARLTQLDPRWLGGEMWGFHEDGGWSRPATRRQPGAGPGHAGRAGRLRGAGRAAGPRCATIVGPPSGGPAVAALEPHWPRRATCAGTSRTWRSPRPPRSRPTRWCDGPTRDDVDVLYPACVAMYTEEVGVSPEIDGGGDLYRARVAQLVAKGWSFARIEDGRVRVQGRGGRRVAVRLPGPGRVRRPGPPRRGPGRRRHGGRRRARPARHRAGGVALRQRAQRAGAGGLRRGPASSRPGPSPRSCSEAVLDACGA